MEPLLWERELERNPPDHVWLRRIAETVALLGYKIETFMAAYAGSQEKPEPEDWFSWREATDPADAGPSGPGVATEEEIRDAWGGAYDTLRSENAGE